MFAAVCVKGERHDARVLEGPVPDWKIFGSPGTGNGAARSSFGLPRFREASFLARFPFGTVTLKGSPSSSRRNRDRVEPLHAGRRR